MDLPDYQKVETIPVNQNHHFQFYGANLWNNLATNLEKIADPEEGIGDGAGEFPDTGTFKRSLGWIQDHIRTTERPVPTID